MAGRDTDCNYCKQITLSTGFCLRRAVNERTDEYRRPTLSRPRFLPRISSRLTRSRKPRFEWHDIEINFITTPRCVPPTPPFPRTLFENSFVRFTTRGPLFLSSFLSLFLSPPRQLHAPLGSLVPTTNRERKMIIPYNEQQHRRRSSLVVVRLYIYIRILHAHLYTQVVVSRALDRNEWTRMFFARFSSFNRGTPPNPPTPRCQRSRQAHKSV